MNPATPDVADAPPGPVVRELTEKADGPGAAMVISAGFAIFVLGCLTILAEASEGASTWLTSWQWGRGVGALAGKTTIASLAYFGSLTVLWIAWNKKDVNLKKAFFVGLMLAVLGAIGTFPKFFELFAA